MKLIDDKFKNRNESKEEIDLKCKLANERREELIKIKSNQARQQVEHVKTISTFSSIFVDC
jgi:hypothetical protein